MANTTTPPFYTHSLAKELDLDRIAETVIKHKRLWEPRSKDVLFYTIGKNAYMDGATPDYARYAPIYNNFLLSNFADLYIVVLNHLSEALGDPVFLAEDLALPGFHIFEIDERVRNQAGTWHYDHPHITLNLPKSEHNSTFTVSIRMPKSGGGLDWLDDQNNEQHLAYNDGDIIWHNGRTLHRIAGVKDVVQGEYRISFQGHLIHRNNRMEVYW